MKNGIIFGDDTESQARDREIKILLSYIDIQKDDLVFFSDYSYLGDFTNSGQSITELANVIREKINMHFDEELYLWQIVDIIKNQNPKFFDNL